MATPSFSWCSVLVCLMLVRSIESRLPRSVRIAAVLDRSQDGKHALAFDFAVQKVNALRNILPDTRLVAEVVRVPDENSYAAQLETCQLLSKGVAAILGPQSEASATHIRSILDSVEVPFIDTRLGYKMNNRKFEHVANHQDYSVNLHPDVDTFSSSFLELILRYGWDSITILYEDQNSMMRLKTIFDNTRVIGNKYLFRIVVKELKSTESNGYRDVLREAYLNKASMVVLDCSKNIMAEVLKQAQQVGMVSEDNFFLITSLDAHTVDLEDFKYGGTNFTAFRLVNTNSLRVKSVLEELVRREFELGREMDVRDGNLDTDTALVYDAVHLFAIALHQLSRIQDISIPSLDCSGRRSWQHGSSLLNYMKLTSFTGLSGQVSFDTWGRRSDFELEVLELQATGLEPIGTWTKRDGLNLTRAVEKSENFNPANIMANKTFVVALLEAPPYTMLKEETKKLEGNERFEGFAVDLMDAIAKHLHFNVTYKLGEDGNHGSSDEHGHWNGLMREVQLGPELGGADFAVADLSITSDRASAVTFSMPWMNLGISIIYIRPRKAPPSLLSFLSPFTPEVWLYTAISFVVVSLAMWVIARFSPYEWDNPYPCIDEPEELENQWSLSNSFWFTIGSLMQQGSDVAPKSQSVRILAAMWYFFALIMISSYTANLAAFLTVETLEKPIESAESLAAQKEIKYGTLEGGSTFKFFQESTLYPFNAMYNEMIKHAEEVFVHSNEEGVNRVKEAKGKYAFLMESSSIKYIVERDCDLTQIGGKLDSKGYGIPMTPEPIGKQYKDLIDAAILALQEEGTLHNLYVKWWKQKRGGGLCGANGGGGEDGGVAELGLPNVAGVFLITLLGCAIAIVVALFEFLLGTTQRSEELGTSWVTEMREDIRFALKCHGSSKKVRKPLTNEESSSSGDDSRRGGHRSSSTSSSSSSSPYSSSSQSWSSGTKNRNKGMMSSGSGSGSGMEPDSSTRKGKKRMQSGDQSLKGNSSA